MHGNNRLIDLFVYGTLRDEQLRRALLGNAAPHRATPARAHGWIPARIAGVDYPALAPAHGRCAEGAVLRQLSPRAVQLLTEYEGDEYVLSQISVELGAASSAQVAVYLPTRALLARAGPPFAEWDFDTWARSTGAARRRRGRNRF
ncbi:MAG: gamma-glutamylcyclotransferase [Neomegalonema sp.]|nr:gamma-glutamylcyclotransferase [Neomegalonema sp.]